MIMRNFFSAMALLFFLTCLMNIGAHAQSPNEIEIRDSSFQPEILTVPVGATVTWINVDTIDHTVISNDGSFHSGYIAPGKKFSYFFDRPGYYSFHCNIRPFMHGKVEVTPKADTALSIASNAYADAAPADMIQSNRPKYSQFDQMVSEPTPASHITAPQECDICDMESNALADLYVQAQDQAVPYYQYLAYAKNAGGNVFLIQGPVDWTQYAMVPQGERLSLIAISSTEGKGYLYETYPDGRKMMKDYYFYPYSQIGFYADTIGQHFLSFSIDNQVSNSIVVDVVDSNAASNLQTSHLQQAYLGMSQKQQGYQQSSYNPSGYQLQQAPPAEDPSTMYNSFWERSAVKIDRYGRLTFEGLQGTEYYLQPPKTNVLIRGLFSNGILYILVANPNNVAATFEVDPQVKIWNLLDAQVMYGDLKIAKIGNLLQIKVPAFQSGVIAIQLQKKRYSFTIGPKPANSFSAGPKPAYSFSAGPKQASSFSAGPKPPYSFRIGY